jgi:hypothetical protein
VRCGNTVTSALTTPRKSLVVQEWPYRRCSKVFDEMLAAGEVMPTAVMYNALIRGRREESNGRHDPNASRPRSSRRRKCEYSVANQEEKPRSEDSGRA